MQSLPAACSVPLLLLLLMLMLMRPPAPLLMLLDSTAAAVRQARGLQLALLLPTVDAQAQVLVAGAGDACVRLHQPLQLVHFMSEVLVGLCHAVQLPLQRGLGRLRRLLRRGTLLRPHGRAARPPAAAVAAAVAAAHLAAGGQRADFAVDGVEFGFQVAVLLRAVANRVKRS